MGAELVGRDAAGARISSDLELRDGAADLRADMHILTVADHGVGLARDEAAIDMIPSHEDFFLRDWNNID